MVSDFFFRFKKEFLLSVDSHFVVPEKRTGLFSQLNCCPGIVVVFLKDIR